MIVTQGETEIVIELDESQIRDAEIRMTPEDARALADDLMMAAEELEPR